MKKPKIKLEFAGGGVVYRRSRQGPLIGFILDPYRKWTFAKGHAEPGESMEEAARRETQEEMGLENLTVVAPLGKMSIWFRERFRHGQIVRGERALIHKFIYYFLMKTSRRGKTHPQRAERIGAVRWVPLVLARATASYKNILPILNRAIEIIRQREFERRGRASPK